MNIALFILGVYHVLFALGIKPYPNLTSFVLFKAVPLCGGVYTCWYAAKAVGWV